MRDAQRWLRHSSLTALLLLVAAFAFACGDDDGNKDDDTAGDVTNDAEDTTGTDTTGTDTTGTDTTGTDTTGTDTTGTDTTTTDTTIDTTDTTADVTPTCDRSGFTPVEQDAESNGDDYLIVNAYSSATLPLDWMSIELWAGTGNNPAINDVGTYTLGSSAAELNYKTCGTCVLISTECNDQGCAKDFLATSGTLDITDLSLVNAPVAGTLTDVTLVEVTLASDFTSTVVENGETWCIDSMNFGTTVYWPLCEDDGDCIGSPDGALCEVNSGWCVECLTNDDCDLTAGEVCNETDFICEVPVGPTDRLGCMDSDAANYDAAATLDNGNCLYAVTFNVDTTGHTVTTGVDLVGSWNWSQAPVVMTDANTDGVYTVTLNLHPGAYQYLFRIDGTNETITDDNDATSGFCDVVPDDADNNRGLIVMDAPITGPSLAFGTCAAAEGCTDAAAANYDATATLNIGSCIYHVVFQVDTTGSTVTTGMTVVGSWNWNGAPIAMTDGDTNGIYDATLSLRPGNYEYLFQLDGTTENIPDDNDATNGFCDVVADDAFDNRGFRLGMVDLTLPAELLDTCSGGIAPCADADAANYHTGATVDHGKCLYDVTFSVDVSALATAPTSVGIFGSWDGWCEGCGAMTDGGSGVYTITQQLAPGRYEFKFLKEGSAADSEPLPDQAAAEGFCDVVADTNFNNRAIGVGTAPLTVPTMTWGVCL